MTEVRFYIVPEKDWLDSAKFAARLTRFLRRRDRLVLLSPPGGQEDQLTELLWAYPEESFLPVAENSGIAVGMPQSQNDQFDVLINLTTEVLDGHARFKDLCEVVPSNEDALEKARDRWRYYKERGHALKRFDTENI